MADVTSFGLKDEYMNDLVDSRVGKCIQLYDPTFSHAQSKALVDVASLGLELKV